jgi:tRNA (adenine37-N6)-methyltransferase
MTEETIMAFSIQQIGTVRCGDTGYFIALGPGYAPALTGLEGFGHVQVLWWFDRCDDLASRSTLTAAQPYAKGPGTVGVFATRSPLRPNPVAVSTSYVTHIDHDSGVIGLAWIDAEDGTPVLDIKPYTPSVDRIERPAVPEWCAHWPKSVEESADFDWGPEFNFS